MIYRKWKKSIGFWDVFFSRRGRWSWDVLFGWNLCFSGREKWKPHQKTPGKNVHPIHLHHDVDCWWIFLHKLSSKRLLSNMCYVFEPKKRNFLGKWSSFDKPRSLVVQPPAVKRLDSTFESPWFFATGTLFGKYNSQMSEKSVVSKCLCFFLQGKKSKNGYI